MCDFPSLAIFNVMAFGVYLLVKDATVFDFFKKTALYSLLYLKIRLNLSDCLVIYDIYSK